MVIYKLLHIFNHVPNTFKTWQRQHWEICNIRHWNSNNVDCEFPILDNVIECDLLTVILSINEMRGGEQVRLGLLQWNPPTVLVCLTTELTTLNTSFSTSSRIMGQVRLPSCCIRIPSAMVSTNCGGFGHSLSPGNRT